ncbi:MAG: hypothetical protein Q4C91_00875 [Eubacteriales bacterium]|nr:hypothetical protein [Eubacteriales bacterium]
MYRKRITKQTLKKSTAVLTASTLILGGSSAVFAASSYQETEKEALSALTESMAEGWDKSLDEYGTAKQGEKADISLNLEDAGRSILGLMVPVDLSWLNNIGMDMDVAIEDAVEAVDAEIYVNDTTVGTMRILLDLASMVEYIQIPEISESYLKADLLEENTIDVENGDGSDSVEIDEEAFEKSAQITEAIMSDPEAYLPDGATMKEILDRYVTMLLDYLKEGPSVEETVSVSGIGQDCTVYEGQMTEKDAVDFVKEALTAAKEDEQLKELIESWQEFAEDTQDLYGDFQKAVEDALADLETEEELSETEYISSKIWVSEQGKIVGREFAVCEGIDSEPLFTWKNPHKDDASGLLIELNSDEGVLSLGGSGETKDGKMNGSYDIASDGVIVANVVMEDYDLETAKAGYPNGSFTVSFPQGDVEESESAYNPLANFSLVLNLISDEASDTSEIELSVLSAGVSLGSLKINGSLSEGMEIPDIEKAGTIYDAANEADMEAYAEELDFGTILDNARTAGVPEALVAQLDEALQSALSGEEETDLTEDGDASPEENQEDAAEEEEPEKEETEAEENGAKS